MKAFTLAILKTVFKTATESSSGMMALFTEELITTAKEKEMENSITLKILASVEASGSEVCLMDRANTSKAKISVSSVFGARADL